MTQTEMLTEVEKKCKYFFISYSNLSEKPEWDFSLTIGNMQVKQDKIDTFEKCIELLHAASKVAL